MPWNSALKELILQVFPKETGFERMPTACIQAGGPYLRAPFLTFQGSVFALAQIGLWGPPITVDGREFEGLSPQPRTILIRPRDITLSLSNASGSGHIRVFK